MTALLPYGLGAGGQLRHYTAKLLATVTRPLEVRGLACMPRPVLLETKVAGNIHRKKGRACGWALLAVLWLTRRRLAGWRVQGAQADGVVAASSELRRQLACDSQLLGALGAVMLEAAAEAGKASAYAAMALRQVRLNGSGSTST